MEPRHVLLPDERTLHGHWDPSLPPALTVEPGTTVRIGTLDSGWNSGPYTGPDTVAGLAVRPRHPAHDPAAGHALTGPVAVAGAEVGQVLAVRIDGVVPGAFGTTYVGLRSTALNERLGVTADPKVHRWTLDATAGVGRNHAGHSVALRPFLGVMGVPPAEPGQHSTIPPYWHGGNIDCRELVAGSTLYLPVTVPGGLLSVGDGHAAQGDGEVAGTAIECPMDAVDLHLDVLPDLFGAPVRTPVARTPAGWVTMGVADDLDEAMATALDAMLDVMAAVHGIGRSDALALASVVVDLRVTQVVNQVVGVHAVLPWGAVR
ncbi:acetamidase/formamidase family protein [Modestobacter sp. SSW1-42]|uniref:acetamidase/formamidase family protein n=1 Tax=Modestobacter sp. SSW1-42 TaxID=596372 RepID=UPI0039856CE2